MHHRHNTNTDVWKKIAYRSSSAARMFFTLRHSLSFRCFTDSTHTYVRCLFAPLSQTHPSWMDLWVLREWVLRSRTLLVIRSRSHSRECYYILSLSSMMLCVFVRIQTMCAVWMWNRVSRLHKNIVGIGCRWKFPLCENECECVTKSKQWFVDFVMNACLNTNKSVTMMSYLSYS